MVAARQGDEGAAATPVPFGRYLLLEPIAEGRIGTLHRACRRRPGKPDQLVAIKRVAIALSADAAFDERFCQVMTRAAELTHPAHCAIQDIGRAPDGSLYVAMELVAGKDLARVAAAAREAGTLIPALLVAYVGSRVADALGAAHELTDHGKPAPLFHGELAPADIMLGFDGGVRLTGLGSAALQAVSPDPAPRYAYRAPEFDRGICNARSDVFSLGACLYELPTGDPASMVTEGDADAVANRRRESHITQLVPHALERIVRRALAEDPAARWKTATELARALQQWCSTQSGVVDAGVLSAFVRGLFDARPSYAKLVRANEENRLSVPARSGRPEPRQPEPFVDPSENTPARGNLMEKLAAGMAESKPEQPREETNEQPRDQPRAQPREQPRAQPRAQRRTPEIPQQVNPPEGMWDDDSNADRWIAESEERDVSEWRVQSQRPAAAQRQPAPAVVPAAAVEQPVSSSLSAFASPTGESRRLVIGLAAAALLIMIAAVALLRGSDRDAGAAPAATASMSAVAPRVAPAAQPSQPAAQPVAAPTPVAAQPARTAEPAPQAARAVDDSASRGASARRRRADAERDAYGSTRSDSQAAQIDSEAAEEREPEPAPIEQAAPVASVRERVEPVVEAAPTVPVPKPAVVSAPAPAPVRVPTVVRPPAVAPAIAPRGVSQAAVLIEKTTPRLSARARRIGITEGFVSVEFTVDRSGGVTGARVVQADPPGVLDDAALKAIRDWRYKPALANGSPVDSKQRITIRFTD